MSLSDIVRASVTDGPLGPLLGALAARSFSGEIAVETAGKRYAIELRRGMVIAATSPLASDSALRVALTSHLVTPVHIAALTRALAAAGKRDEIDVVTEVAHLSTEQATTLRTRTITQRAARAFALDEGEITIRPLPPRGLGKHELEVEVAAVIFLGARMNLSEVRLANDLRRLGGRFALVEGGDPRLPRFGFGADGVAIAKLLCGAGATLAEVEATHREIDPRVAAATIYALVSCGAALSTAPSTARTTTETPPLVARTVTPVSAPRTVSEAFERTPTLPASARGPVPPRTRSDVIVPRTMTPRPGMREDVFVPRTLTPALPRTRSDAMTMREMPALVRAPTDLAVPLEGPAVPRTLTPPPGVTRARSASSPSIPRTMTPAPAAPRTVTPDGMTLRTPSSTSRPPPTRSSSPAIARTFTPRWTVESIADLEQTVASRLGMIDQGADYFSVLGLVFDAPGEAVRAAHAQLARQLQPDVLAQHATPALQVSGARLLEQITAAESVLTDPARRSAYVAALRRGGEPLVGIPRTRTEEERSPVDEAVHRALLAMRANQPEKAAVELARAIELEPTNIDHAVMLAWARFCAATDKGAVAAEIRKVLVGATRTSDKPQLPTFYLGRVERMLGRDKEALQLFHDTLDLDPANLEAAAEVRVLEARLAAARRR